MKKNKRSTISTAKDSKAYKRPCSENKIYIPVQHQNWIIQRKENPQLLNKKIKEDLSKISIPGLKNVTNKKSPIWLRLFWCFIIAICILLTVYQISDRVQYYLLHPTTLDVQIKAKPTVELPNITICPHQLNRYFIETNLSATNLTLDEQAEELKALYEKNYLIWDNFEFHSSCGLITSEKNMSECPIRVERKIVPSLMGYCYVISFIGELNYKGFKTNLQIIMKDPDKIKTNKAEDIGFYFSVHADEYFIQSHIEQYGRPAFYSKHSIWSVTRKQFNFINFWNRPCVSAKEFADCMNNCIVKKLLTILPCRPPYLPTGSLRNCYFNDTLIFWFNTTNLFITHDYQSCGCSRKCRDITFMLTESEIVYVVEENVVSFSLRFDDNSVSKVKEENLYTHTQLLSDIGGNLGLFLGFCVLTFIEIFEAIIIRMINQFSG